MRISDWSSDVCSSDLMEQALFDTVTVELRAGEAPAGSRGAHAFRASGSTLIEPGFIAAYTQSFDTPSGKEDDDDDRSEEHTSELQSLMRISYAVFCLKKKKKKNNTKKQMIK